MLRWVRSLTLVFIAALAAGGLFIVSFAGGVIARERLAASPTVVVVSVAEPALDPQAIEAIYASISPLVPAPLPVIQASYPETRNSYAGRMTQEEVLAVRDYLIGFGTKVVEIDLTEQTMTAWQRGEVLWSTRVSTGRKDKPTRSGVWQVLDKYPVAWGSAFEDGDQQVWKMPYWLGIYYAGASENGIHELPFINGRREGERSLGRAVSHGCVRVPKGTAKTLYDWVDVGTPVVIRY